MLLYQISEKKKVTTWRGKRGQLHFDRRHQGGKKKKGEGGKTTFFRRKKRRMPTRHKRKGHSGGEKKKEGTIRAKAPGKKGRRPPAAKNPKKKKLSAFAEGGKRGKIIRIVRKKGKEQRLTAWKRRGKKKKDLSGGMKQARGRKRKRTRIMLWTEPFSARKKEGGKDESAPYWKKKRKDQTHDRG